MKKLTTEEFIEKAKVVHKNKYDYSMVEVNGRFVKIICSKHGIFSQRHHDHLSGKGCPKCNGGIKIDTKTFIERANKVHNNFYDYSSVEYKNSKTKIKIICPNHGLFFQKPNNHMSGYGCKECSIKIRANKRSKGIEKFIKEAKIIHGDKYDYSLSNYKNAHIKIKILCKEHGLFYQSPKIHLQGGSCPKCINNYKGEILIKEFLKKNNLNYECQKTFSGCKYKRNLKFDFYLPDKNTLLEYDGVLHFIETSLKNNLEESLLRDKIKDRFCIKNNINLIRIAFWELDDLEKILKKSLLLKL